MRFRLWNDQEEGYCNLTDVRGLAQRVHQAGLKILIDFHYSDVWADPGTQTNPAAWESLSYTELVQVVHDYTYNVVHALITQGVDFDIIGLSYYSTWHGSIETMQANLEDLAERYGKPIVIAETAYPWTLEWDDWTNNIIGEKSQLLPGYPASVTGHRYLTSREAGAYSCPQWVGAWFPLLGRYLDRHLRTRQRWLAKGKSGVVRFRAYCA